MTPLSDFSLLGAAARHQGLPIALVGLSIVFLALLLISVFLTFLPRALSVFAKYFPESEAGHGSPVHPESRADDDELVIAGLGFVLHTEFQKQLQTPPQGR
jgi:hypothetical protein